MIYFDTAYLVKCYIKEPGWEIVRSLAKEKGDISCSVFGRMELHAAFHRHLREGNIAPGYFTTILAQFQLDENNRLWNWLPISTAAMQTVSNVFRDLLKDIYLRTADALHLATAKVNAVPELYSNDVRLLAAAQFFGVTAENVL